MALKFVGPYSQSAYDAAEQIAAGNTGVPYSPETLSAANEIIRLNQTGDGVTLVQGASTTRDAGGSGTTTTKPKLNQAAVDATQSAIGSLDTELNTGNANIDESYNSIKSRYDREAEQAKADFNENSDANSNNLQKNKQNALLAAAMGRKGLRGTLAAIGALGGDGAFLADRAVTTGANADIGEAADTYGTNAQMLDKSFKKFGQEDEDRRKEADVTRTNQRTALEGSVASKRQSMYQKMAELYGGAEDTASADEWLGKAGALNNEIASKTRVQSAQFSPRSAAFTPDKLESYLAGAGDMTVDVKSGGANGSNATSIMAGRNLRKKDEEKVTA